MSRRRVPVVDLGARLGKRLTALPERLRDAPIPPETPRGIGELLWHGSETTRIRREIEYRVHKRDRTTLVLRVRATEDDALIGVYSARLASNGSLLAVPRSNAQLRQLADALEGVGTGERKVEGVEATARGALRLLAESSGLHVTRRRNPIARERTTRRPPLPAVFWASMVTAAALVHDFGSRMPGALVKQGVTTADGLETITARIGVEDLLSPMSDERPWWHVASVSDRAAVAEEILAQAVAHLEKPPPWSWWAGTMRRTAGWVRRSSYTGTLQAVPVMSWTGERSGVQTAVRRFVRQPVHDEQLSLLEMG